MFTQTFPTIYYCHKCGKRLEGRVTTCKVDDKWVHFHSWCHEEKVVEDRNRAIPDGSLNWYP